MMRNTEVPQMMRMVEAALLRAGESPEPGTPIFVVPRGDGSTEIGRLRASATIDIDRWSGSDRPVVGPAIVFAKRVTRRALRWYLQPAFEQQSSFNQTVLDLLERAHLENERLRSELDVLGRPARQPGGTDRP
jgi:hypothetical protein